jgi:hypothetical protein
MALGALSFFLFVTAGGDPRRSAVATIFAALFAHQAVIPIVYALLLPKLVDFDAMLVGSAMKLTIAGATWHGNIIAVPSGHAIEIEGICCSFHNVSLAVLSWVALTKLERPQWLGLDLVVLAVAAGFQILLNTVRMYLMAQSLDMYLYWHNGAGSQIFAICASAGAVLICACGANLASSFGACYRPLVASTP